MLPVQRGNELNEALSSFSDLSEVGQIWWLHLVVTLWLVVLGDSEVAIPPRSQLPFFGVSSSSFDGQQLPGGDEEDSPSLAFKRLQELEARDRRFRAKLPRCTIDIH